MSSKTAQPQQRAETITTATVKTLLLKKLAPVLNAEGQVDEDHPQTIITSVLVALSERMDVVGAYLAHIVQKVQLLEQALTGGDAPAGEGAAAAPANGAAGTPPPGGAPGAAAAAPVDEYADVPKPTNTSRVDKVEPLKVQTPDKVEPLSPSQMPKA